MFTGIIDHCGKIKSIDKNNDGSIKISIATTFDDLAIGESIAIDGMCLTVTKFINGLFHCDISLESLDKSIAEKYTIGSKVNLERAMKATDRFGGHYVTGHVDCRGILLEKKYFR